MNYRKRDEQREKNMMAELNSIYKACGYTIDRRNNHDDQIKAIDVILTKNNVKMVVDEKAATSMDDAFS